MEQQKLKEKRKSSKERAVVTTAVAKPLSDDEKQLIEASVERNKKAWELPIFKNRSPKMNSEISSIEGTAIAWGKIRDILKTNHVELAAIELSSAAEVMPFKQEPDDALNLVMQQFAALQPQNHLETMLLNQMIQVNSAASKCMARAFLDGQTFAGKELNANLAIKFQRTFVAQIEALQKLRGKGGQKVTVEHVHVYQGGQAIVGNVEKGEG